MNKNEFQSLIEKVKVKTNILSVIEQRIELDNKYEALCPFHHEKRPSFLVQPRGQYFYCFGCGVGGDAIKFVQLYEGVNFREAVCILAEEANIRY